jgi:hypothetical protein
MSTIKLTCLGSIVACLAASTVGLAADNCSGHYVSVGVSGDSSEQSSGNSLATFRAVTVNITDDKNSPLNMSVGDCVGTVITAATRTDASGRCTRKDKDGDLYSYEWAMPAGAEKGTWKFVSGTGKYSNAKWTGWWQQTMADGKVAGGIWGGNCR